MGQTTRAFTAIYKKYKGWYTAWVEEIPGVNTQGKTLGEAKENLREALALVLETSKLLSDREVGGADVLRERVTVSPS